MDKWGKRLQLLFLFTIFFVYMTIRGVLDNNTASASFWGIFTIIYVLSLIVAIIFWRKFQKLE
ncbi:MAG: hypothetical protein ACFFAS_13865 [Promethearchaeota archaeon]